MIDKPLGAIRISTVIQDVLAFIVPAVVTAIFVSRKPAELLCLTRKPTALTYCIIAALLFISIPLQEAIIYWNYHLSLPASMSDFEIAARQIENNAFELIKSMMADTSAINLIVNALIIGVFAGFAEEILFRGCFLRLLLTGGVNSHVAIWVVAICFSALHFQLFGFIPRVLLGAYFGYLLIWSRSIWAPIAAHILNNLMFVITAWYQIKAEGLDSFSDEPTLWSPTITIVSALFSALALYFLWRNRVYHQA
ncbi:MAG: CPBP family intramembrane metalloprotease [Muribaculaceae bacterium]|nr:CPBP family intramembrane metalloprotease [Muribaculaceae bacterium]